MDFKGWKKVKEDKDTTTMMHEKGHTMTLSNKAMPKIQRERLKKLPIQEKSGVAFYEDGGTTKQSDAGITPVSAVSNAPIPQSPAPEASQPLLNPDETLNAPAAVSLQQGAAREQQAVDAAKGVAAANMERGYIQGNNEIQQALQNNVNELKTHTDETANAIKSGLINPNHYQENMSTGEKVATAFGLLMGGFKQGFSGGSNPAMDYLNSQINRDIDAQKARSDQQKTILGAYQTLYGDQAVANNLTKIALNDAYTHKGYQIAAQLMTPQAKATADAFSAQKAIENNQLLLDSAGRLGKLGAPGMPQAQNAPNQGIMPTAYNPEGEPNKSESDMPILNPNAQQRLDQLRYTPKAKEELDQIKSQYTSAQQADNLMKQLPGVFNEMSKNVLLNGPLWEQKVKSFLGVGAAGYNARNKTYESIPLIGSAAQKTNDALADDSDFRSFKSNQTRIISDIAAALKGTNIGGEEIANIVKVNSPERGDTPEVLAQKQRNIRTFIKNSVQKSLLKDWGLAP